MAGPRSRDCGCEGGGGARRLRRVEVRFAKGVLAGVAAVLTATATNGRVEVLMPLFGGVQGMVPQGNVAWA